MSDTLALVALGSNLGDRAATLDAALDALAATPGVALRAASRYHETTPVGGPSGQGAFLNAAAALATTLDPLALHARLRQIETDAGRQRRVRWGERTLDLDLILFGGQVVETPELTVPHPRFALRRFVLAPLAEVAPTAVDPITLRTVGDLLANLDRRPSYLALLDHRGDSSTLFRRLTAALSAIGLSQGSQPGAGDRLIDVSRERMPEQCLRLLEQTATELRADRWTEAVWGDRWIVTDFWFERIDDQARSTLTAERFPMVHDRYRELLPTVIQPTFLVADRRAGPERFGHGTVPIFHPESDDPDQAVAEILAACAATRS